MKIKKILRQLVLVLVICLACLAPLPIALRRKDDSPKVAIEQLDLEEEDDHLGKELF